jgi:hypothetical protein
VKESGGWKKDASDGRRERGVPSLGKGSKVLQAEGKG